MLHLTRYPKQIRSIRREILNLQRQQRRLTETLATIDAEIDRTVAFEESLKNEAQRKAARLEMRQSNEVRSQAAKRLDELGDRIAELEIDLEYYRGEFSAVKLLDRKFIAQREPALPQL